MSYSNFGKFVGRLPGAPLRAPEPVLEICRRLRKAGFEAFAVGGAVRDVLLNRPAADWDIATSATVDQVEFLFRDTKQFTLNKRTVTLIFDGSSFELTPFRGSLPTIEADLALRDFTIDAIAFDPENGKLLDPEGGKEDLKRRLIRCVGDPISRFKDDPLRLMRAVRISAQLGFKMEAATLEAVSRCTSLLLEPASERIRDELVKTILTQKPSAPLSLLVKTGLLSIIIPELLEGRLKRQSHPHRHTILMHSFITTDYVPPVMHLRLAALLHDVAKPRVRTRSDHRYHFYGHEKVGAEIAALILDRLKFGNDTKELVSTLIANHMVIYDSTWSDGAVRRLIARVGLDKIKDLIALKRADMLAQGADSNRNEANELEKRIESILSKFASNGLEPLKLKGSDVMEALGIAPGPKVGEALTFLREIIMDDPALNTKERLLEILLARQKKTPR